MVHVRPTYHSRPVSANAKSTAFYSRLQNEGSGVESEGVLASGAGVGAGLAQAAQALDQHRRGFQGLLAINQIVENLIVPRSAQVEELFNRALFRPRKAPPAAFEFQDSGFELT